MPVVDLRGRSAERQAQILQMMNQMRNRDSGQTSAMDELNKEFEKQEAQRREDERKDLQLREQIRQGQGKLDIDQWKAGREDVRQERSEDRADDLFQKQSKHLDAQTEASEASAASSRATTESTKAKTIETNVDIEGKRRDQKTKSLEDAIERARGIVNDAIRRLSQGDVLTREDTDALESSQRLLSGNPALTLPRKADGSWDAPANFARGIVNPKGLPTADYAGDIEDIEGYTSAYGKLVGDAMKARKRGAGPETMILFEDKFMKENALNKNQLEYRYAKKFLDVGDFAGAKKVINGLATIKDQKLKLPSVEERQEFGRQTRLVDDMDSMQKEWENLKASGIIPVGALKQPFYKMTSFMGVDNPRVSSFIKRVEQMKGEYLLYLSGRAATDAERDDLNNRIPTIFDSPQTFEMSLPQFREKVAKDMSIDAGILHSFGMKIPDTIPIIDPGDIIRREGKLPNLILENGYIPGDYAQRHIEGLGIIGGNGSKSVAGPGEFRQKLGPQDQLGESSETGPGAQAPPAEIDLDPMHYPDPVAARGWIKEYKALKGIP